VIHRPQPPETVARLQAILSAESDFSLAALRTIAGLSASLVIALAAVRPEADPQGLWNAANLEEDWQAQLWGRDAEAEARREKRFEAFRSAMRFALLAGA
jgi:chaperone required for assembly of F1-ATPase